MKRILSILLVLALVVTAFAACGDKKEEENAVTEVNTVAIMATYVVTNDMSEDQAYAITKALWETEAVKTSHAKCAQMDIKTTLNGLGEVPLHPGAAKYYIEQGIIREEDVKIATAGTTTIEKIKVGTGGQTGTYYAFANASPGDIFVQKAPASTIGDLAEAVRQLFDPDAEIKIIGIQIF